ncbi:hypothetical protein SISSUDRAFT_312131 [Sistotremastrum suecicum HHB10207 ss-3]|uniref:Uncharacterized protein n=1 Tax=Sistotremastrum suecicum HHB10207 ss-3 TaxID=1314776 RepID=A0A165ZCQ2_9AGAM|nr:hypothetical protein SISSUDRAFT_312131 [Sistotremastrum suecicum HHB10207 ss-3]
MSMTHSTPYALSSSNIEHYRLTVVQNFLQDQDQEPFDDAINAARHRTLLSTGLIADPNHPDLLTPAPTPEPDDVKKKLMKSPKRIKSRNSGALRRSSRRSLKDEVAENHMTDPRTAQSIVTYNSKFIMRVMMDIFGIQNIEEDVPKLQLPNAASYGLVTPESTPSRDSEDSRATPYPDHSPPRLDWRHPVNTPYNLSVRDATLQVIEERVARGELSVGRGISLLRRPTLERLWKLRFDAWARIWRRAADESVNESYINYPQTQDAAMDEDEDTFGEFDNSTETVIPEHQLPLEPSFHDALPPTPSPACRTHIPHRNLPLARRIFHDLQRESTPFDERDAPPSEDYNPHTFSNDTPPASPAPHIYSPQTDPSASQISQAPREFDAAASYTSQVSRVSHSSHVSRPFEPQTPRTEDDVAVQKEMNIFTRKLGAVLHVFGRIGDGVVGAIHSTERDIKDGTFPGSSGGGPTPESRR